MKVCLGISTVAGAAVTALLGLTPFLAVAQPTPVPRLSNGKPDLSGPGRLVRVAAFAAFCFGSFTDFSAHLPRNLRERARTRSPVELIS